MAKNLIIVFLLAACAGLSLALVQQLQAPRGAASPAVVAGASPGGEVELALQESYLERQIRDRVGQSPGAMAPRDLRLDLRPGNQAQIRGTTTVLGLAVPVTVDLTLRADRGAIRATVLGGKAGPVDLPAGIQRETEAVVNDAIARAFRLEGTGLELTGLRTSDTSVTLTLRERGG